MLLPDLDVEKATWFYKNYMLEPTSVKSVVYQQYGFAAPEVGSTDWEVFAAILLRDRAKGGNGADLERHEVKSAYGRNSFEYQYHKFHGLDKLEEDKHVDHTFISYGANYQDVDVRFVEGAKLGMLFESWKADLIKNYEQGKQRFRKSISFGFVSEQGQLLMAIRNGEVVYPSLSGGSILV